MNIALNIGTIFGILAATSILFDTLTKSQSAPQQAAGAAMATALVIIPYVAARTFNMIKGGN